MLRGPMGDSVVTAWPQDCFTPRSLLHKHSEWPSTLCADVEVKPAFRKGGRKKGRVLDWEESCVVERRGRRRERWAIHTLNIKLCIKTNIYTDISDDDKTNVAGSVVLSLTESGSRGTKGGAGDSGVGPHSVWNSLSWSSLRTRENIHNQ